MQSVPKPDDPDINDLDCVQRSLPDILQDTYHLSSEPELQRFRETAYPYSRIRVLEFEVDPSRRVRLYLKRIVSPSNARAYLPKKLVAREARFLKQLNASMPHDSVRLVAAFPDHSTIVTEECAGVSLGSVLHSAPYWRRPWLDSKRHEAIHFRCGEWLKRFHSVTRHEKSNLRPWYSFVSGEMIWRVKKLSRELVRHESLFEACRTKFIEDLKSLESRGCSHICHGDYAPHNIFYSDGALQVIDFSGSKRGNAIADIVNYLSSIAPQRGNLLLSRVLFRKFAGAFLAGYGPVELHDERVLELLLVLQSVKRLVVLDSLRRTSRYPKAALAARSAKQHLVYLESYVRNERSIAPDRGFWPHLHMSAAVGRALKNAT